MRVSTRGRYGLRAMFELARCFGEGPVPMSTVAQRQDLSRKHLHALLTLLKSGGLVRSVLGPGGGFVLARSPARIKLSEILRALEGPISVVHCVADEQACAKANRCAARRVWQELSEAIENMLDNVTLQDMAALEDAAPSSGGMKHKGRRTQRNRARAIKPSDGVCDTARAKGGKR